MPIKAFFRRLIPPLILGIIKFRRDKGWNGNYSTWSEALQHCKGYDAPEILEKCRDALLRVKRGEAVYERDSVVFDEVQYSWPVLAALLRCALERNGKLHVLDFGGSLGSSYFQNRQFLPSLKEFSWSIVEQQHFVACGREYFQDGILQFFENPEECLKECQPNFLLLSCVLQYLEKPYDWIQRLCGLGLDYVLLDLMPLMDTHDRLTIQHVDPAIYPASYPWSFQAPTPARKTICARFGPGASLTRLVRPRCVSGFHGKPAFGQNLPPVPPGAHQSNPQRTSRAGLPRKPPGAHFRGVFPPNGPGRRESLPRRSPCRATGKE